MEDSTKIKLWRLVTLALVAFASWKIWYLLVPENFNFENVLVYAMVVSFMTSAVLDIFSKVMQNHWYDEYLLAEDTDEWIKSWCDAIGITALLLTAGVKTGFFEHLADWIASMI